MRTLHAYGDSDIMEGMSQEALLCGRLGPGPPDRLLQADKLVCELTTGCVVQDYHE
jgi:hypothetical protein